MKSLIEETKEAENNKTAIGHFNVSDLVGLKAIFSTAQELQLPVIIGVSEGEREFIGVNQISALIKSLRDQFGYQIYLNADHTHSLEKLKQVVEAGFDAAVFDASQLSFEENISQTKQAVVLAKNINPNFLVEGELGYIGSGSIMLKEIPTNAAIKPEDLTKTEQAAEFVKQTGIDLLAPAVGNIHGILENVGNPALDIQRISEIKKAVRIPLVLHGGSGIKNEDFVNAIKAGISIIHINTELRLAWRKGIEKALAEKPDEIVPYKLLSVAIDGVKKVVYDKLRLFNYL